MKTNFRRLALIALLTFICVGAAQADITNNLVLWLKMDETSGTNAFDSSTNASNGNIIGFTSPNVPWTTNGHINGAAQVNIPSATTQYISVPQTSTLDFGAANAFTIAAWVMSTGTQLAGSAIISKGTGGGNEQYDLDVNTAKFRMVTRNSSGTATTATATVGPTANYQHVAGVYDGTAHTLKIYVNGQLNVTTTSANLASVKVTSHELSIGNRQSSTGAYNLPFVNGFIDDVHIYNRALSASDVLELYSLNGKAPIVSAQPQNYSCYAGDIAAYSVSIDTVNSTLPVGYQWQLNGANIPGATNATLGITNVQTAMSGQLVDVIITNVIGTNISSSALLTVAPLPAADVTSGLVAYYTFDDTPGSTTAADSTTNATSGTLTLFADTTACWTNGLIAGGLKFNGDGSGANVVAIPSIGTPPPPVLDFSVNGIFTLAAWVNGSTVQSNAAAILARGTGNGGEQFCVDINGGKYRFFVRNALGVIGSATALTTVAPSGTWQHLVCVLDTTKGILDFYINGQLAGEGIASSNLLSSTHEISIGNRQSAAGGYNDPWTGIIDDVHFYNRAFTSADAQALYLQGGVFPPVVVTPPVGASLYIGDSFKLSAAVSGTAPLSYQWMQGSTVLPGATNSSLSFTPTVASNAGNYTLVVTNAYGTTNTAAVTLQLTPFALTNALAAYWTFDDVSGSSTAADSSTNGNNGNLSGFPDFVSEWVSGRTNGALRFNPAAGVNEYVDIPDSASLNFAPAPNFSIAAWVRGATTQTVGGPIIAKGFGGNNEQYAIDILAGGFYRFYLRNAANTVTQLSTPVATSGQWQHIVATYDGAFTTMNFYVNGTLVASNIGAPPTLLADNNHDVTIGDRESTTVSGYNLPFNGTIDDVRIYSRTLSSNDVLSLYQSAGILAPVFYTEPVASASLFVGDNLTLSAFADGTPPLTLQWQLNATNIPGATNFSLSITNAQLTNAGNYTLIVSNQTGLSATSSTSVVQVVAFSITNTSAYYNLDETSGATAADSSGNGNTATLFSFPGDDSEWAPGRINGGLIFNADNSGADYVTAPDSPTLNFSNAVAFTLATWVRATPSQANGAGLIAKGFGGGGEQYALDIHSDLLSARTYRFFVRNGAGTSSALLTTNSPTGRWQHLAATFDGNNNGLMTIYLNGQAIASQTAPPTLLVSTHELSIGNRQSTSVSGYNLPFTGQMDDVRIYQRALKAAEVQSLYALAAPFAPFVYTQPASATNYTGTSVTFAPAVDGTDPLLYQWSKNGNPISGATNSTLSLTNLQQTDAGNYSLFVTNSLNFTNTAAASLTVLPLTFSGGVQLADGTFQLTFNGPANGSYHLYSSPDVTLPISQWSLLAQGNFDGTGTAVVTDFNQTSNNVSQFYRYTLP